MCRQLDGINFAHEFNQRDFDAAFEYFFDVINTATRNNVPSVTVNGNTNRPKWWTSGLQRLKNRRNKLYKRKLRGGDEAESFPAGARCSDPAGAVPATYIARVQNNIASDPSAF